MSSVLLRRFWRRDEVEPAFEDGSFERMSVRHLDCGDHFFSAWRSERGNAVDELSELARVGVVYGNPARDFSGHTSDVDRIFAENMETLGGLGSVTSTDLEPAPL